MTATPVVKWPTTSRKRAWSTVVLDMPGSLAVCR